MIFKSQFVQIFTLALCLYGTTMPMQKQPDIIARMIKNLQESSAYSWAEQHKVPLLIGAGAAVTAGILYNYFWKKPTPDQIKAQIRKETENYRVNCAQNIRNGIEIPNAGMVRTSVPPGTTDYVMKINKLTRDNRVIGINARFEYACDNSTEDVQILYE